MRKGAGDARARTHTRTVTGRGLSRSSSPHLLLPGTGGRGGSPSLGPSPFPPQTASSLASPRQPSHGLLPRPFFSFSLLLRVFHSAPAPPRQGLTTAFRHWPRRRKRGRGFGRACWNEEKKGGGSGASRSRAGRARPAFGDHVTHIHMYTRHGIFFSFF